MSSDIASAIKQICEEKGIAKEMVLETIEAALAAAYRKDFGNKNQNIKVEFDLETGGMRVFDVKTVVEDELKEAAEELKLEREKGETESGEAQPSIIKTDEDKPSSSTATSGVISDKGSDELDQEKRQGVATEEVEELEEVKKYNQKTDITLTEAKQIKKSYKLNDEVRIELGVPEPFGRMAAQTAKQVIIQKLREAERDTLYSDFKTKESQVLTGVVQRREGRLVFIDLGKVTALLLPEEQIDRERYNLGERYKVYILSVNKGAKGPEILVSRAHPEIVRKVFSVEIPEIANGLIEIKSVAREAGFRTKIAVATNQDNIDPIGSCVGQRGTRVQTIINELGGEKIDIIEYSDDPEKYIANALSPAKVSSLQINTEQKISVVKVKEDQLSLAIGKGGQNVRLAARLTGWKIDVAADHKPGAVEPITTAADQGVTDQMNQKEDQEIQEVVNEVETIVADDENQESKYSSSN